MGARYHRSRAKASNPWPFRRRAATKPVCKTARSTMTIGSSTRAAYKAGQRLGDTGLFDAWLCEAGLQNRSNTLLTRLRREFDLGVDKGEGPDTDRTRRTTAGTRYKSHSIHMLEDGRYQVGDSEFDSLADAKRFIDHPLERGNPCREVEHTLKEFQERGLTLADLDEAISRAESQLAKKTRKSVV